MRINRVAALSFGIPLLFLVALLVFRGRLEPLLSASNGDAPKPTLSASPPARLTLSDHIIGVASVIDGDTIIIHGTHIRLNGIDAPESGQLCEVDDRRYLCGQKAAFALSEMLGSKTVDCRDLGRDHYGRTIGQCVSGGLDIQRWLVQQGWAIAYRKYSKEYIADEEQSRAAKLGIWAGTFMEPEEWRRRKRNHTLDQKEGR